MRIYRSMLTMFIGAVFLALALAGCNSHHHHNSEAASVFPLKIGDVGPIADDNPRQQPFVCMTQATDLGKAIVDNHDGVGDAVKDDNGNIVGYSADCGAGMKVEYYYLSTQDPDGKLKKYDIDNPPNDVAAFTNGDGQKTPIIIRHEVGVINRFIYSISLLSPPPKPGEDLNNPDLSEWNGDAIFYFMGGTGIGHTQSYSGFVLRGITNVGRFGEAAPSLPLLEHRYAIMMSTGAAGHTTYNLKLMGETAHMVKQQFLAAYGQPKYTFGLGDSGGSVQQFVFSQTYPDLFDGLIPVQVFPDMITQINPVGDCELLQYYFDKVDAQVNGTGSVDPKWTSWANRQMITGFHGIDLGPSDPPFDSDINTLRKLTSTADKGSDICRQVWFGAVPQYLNPLWGDEGSWDRYYDQSVWDRIPTSFFDDLVDIFGTVPNTNIARGTYDNVGVQYGLVALRRHKITKKEFLDLNAHVGGWVPRQDMVEPGYPFEGSASLSNLDPWSSRNATAEDHLDPSDVAPRSKGNIEAMEAAYNAGLVFRGHTDKPIIIIEPWLEPELNQHASREPFSVRQRLIEARGNADNLAIWMIGAKHSDGRLSFVMKALKEETQWLNNDSRPAAVKNGCYDESGNLIAEGEGVFKGQVSENGSEVLGGLQSIEKPGVCTQHFPIYSDPRVQSGLNVSDHVFKCALKPVATALDDGTYGDIAFTVQEQQRLYQIFPTGVCDYSKPDQGLPADLRGTDKP